MHGQVLEKHAYLLFYSVITNLLVVLNRYESKVQVEDSEMEKLPDELYNWILGYMSEVNELDDESYENLINYFEKSVNKETDVHKEGMIQ